ncbi:MAG TPA: fumarylacetoacetate hydrolase family protein [Gammaproteobacteria bacterium]|nr:fumarylacetoacetate hydrolase family protein [Gammaproteobacteria bacterium]
MKLASIRYRNDDLVAVALSADHLVDVNRLLARASSAPLTSMLEVIRGGPSLLRTIDSALQAVRQNPGSVPKIAGDDVSWYPPVRQPGKICAVAMNNSASNERKISAPDHPAFFLKPASCLVGHREPIRIRRYYGSVHPEPELAAVIARETRDVAARDALDAVFGYTIFNDITGNGMRSEDRFHYWAVYAKKGNPNETERVEQHLSYAGRYKGTDTFGAMGPWLVTKDEVANPDDLTVQCKVAGETIAQDSTRYYNYKVAEVVSFISQFHTLHAGDVVSFGTAFKPAANRKSIHHANFQIVPGPVEISIEGLGTQLNPVIVEDKEIGEWRLA